MFGTKILGTDEYNSLKQKADNFDAVVAAVVSISIGAKSEDIALELITELIKASGNDENGNAAELQLQLTAAERRAETAETRVTELEAENANLRNSPADEPAGVITTSDPGAGDGDIADFADTHAGDTFAILEEMKKDGLL